MYYGGTIGTREDVASTDVVTRGYQMFVEYMLVIMKENR